jgi:hypothetical protein
VLGTGEVTGLVEALSGGATNLSGGDNAPSGGGTAPLMFYRRDPDNSAHSRKAEGLSRSGEAPSRESPGPPVFGLDLPTYLYDADTPRRRATPGTTPT